MQNLDAKVEGSILTLTIDLAARVGRSSSGKSVLVASSQGNKPVPGHPDIKLGVNVYTAA